MRYRWGSSCSAGSIVQPAGSGLAGQGRERWRSRVGRLDQQPQAIYNDGDTYHLKVEGTIISANHAREGGGAIFYVSNDRTGTLLIKKSTLHDNPNDGFFTAGYPGIFFLGHGHPVVIFATLH